MIFKWWVNSKLWLSALLLNANSKFNHQQNQLAPQLNVPCHSEFSELNRKWSFLKTEAKHLINLQTAQFENAIEEYE